VNFKSDLIYIYIYNFILLLVELLCLFVNDGESFLFLYLGMKDVRVLYAKAVSNLNSHSFQSFNLSLQMHVVTRTNLSILI